MTPDERDRAIEVARGKAQIMNSPGLLCVALLEALLEELRSCHITVHEAYALYHQRGS